MKQLLFILFVVFESLSGLDPPKFSITPITALMGNTGDILSNPIEYIHTHPGELIEIEIHAHDLPVGDKVMLSEGATKDVFDLTYFSHGTALKKEGMKNSQWDTYYGPFLDGCKPVDLKKWFEDKRDPDAGVSAYTRTAAVWEKHVRRGFTSAIPIHAAAAHSAYYNKLSDEFAAEDEYYNAVADYEFDEAVEDAREVRELARLKREKINVFRLKKAIMTPKKSHYYKRKKQKQKYY